MFRRLYNKLRYSLGLLTDTELQLLHAEIDRIDTLCELIAQETNAWELALLAVRHGDTEATQKCRKRAFVLQGQLLKLARKGVA